MKLFLLSSMLKGVHSHEEEDTHVTHLLKAQAIGSQGSPNTLGRAPPRETSDHYAPTRSSLTTESAMKQVENNIVFTVHVQVNEHPLKPAVKKLHDADRGHCQRPGEAWWREVRLVPDHDALNVANKIGIV